MSAISLSNAAGKPVVLTIAGSDSGGGAGVQADIKTITAMGAHACTAITAVTAQNTLKVGTIHALPEQAVIDQASLVFDDLRPLSIKTGMLYSREIVAAIASFLKQKKEGPFYVCDPVMVATSGDRLSCDDYLAALKRDLIPLADLLTPNLPEALQIAGLDESVLEKLSADELDGLIEEVASRLLSLGARSVFVKGGHRDGDYCQDYFACECKKFWLTSPRIGVGTIHGGGCALSAAIATAVAQGHPLVEAVILGKAYVNQGIKTAVALGGGSMPLNHGGAAVLPDCLPWISTTAQAGRRQYTFPGFGDTAIGFYPIVDRVSLLEKILPSGIKTAQLRVKDLQGDHLQSEIERAIVIARKYGCRLFVNDYWRIALKHGAYGVHLGQSDMETADAVALEKKGIRLGISTHDLEEVAKALSYRPSYIALGPIYETSTKQMPFSPQGISGFKSWRERLSCPLVAIGGITLESAADLLSAGADGIAVVRDIAFDVSPAERARKWLSLFANRT